MSLSSDEAKQLIVLGTRFKSGNGVPANVAKALSLFEEASHDLRCGPVACVLASGIYEERGDVRNAFEWQKRGARLGFWDTMVSVVNAFARGEPQLDCYVAYTWKERKPIRDTYREAYAWLKLGQHEQRSRLSSQLEPLAAFNFDLLVANMLPHELERAALAYEQLQAEYSANHARREALFGRSPQTPHSGRLLHAEDLLPVTSLVDNRD